MHKQYLVNCEYDNSKERIVLTFSKNINSILEKTTIIKLRFNPYFITNLNKSLLDKLLFEFKKEIRIENSKLTSNHKLIAKNYEILKQCMLIINKSTNQNIILIEPQRQFLITNGYSYYDQFLIENNSKIKLIKDNTSVHNFIINYLSSLNVLDKAKQQSITTNFIINNLLKIKCSQGLDYYQIINILFENYFFKKELSIDSIENKIYYQNNLQAKHGEIEIDFSNVWPYLLEKRFYNLGYETLDCNCCKPKTIFENNVLFNSIVEVTFLKNGFYFISKDYSFAKKFYYEKPNLEERERYKKENKLKDFPIGPFFNGHKELIPLLDALELSENKDIIINQEISQNQLHYTCKIKESFISEIVREYLCKIKDIESTINISSYLNYSTSNFNNLSIENNCAYLEYLTEHSILINIIEQIPKFLQHSETKFYNQNLDLAIRSIKAETLNKINVDNQRISNNLNNCQKVIVYEKNFVNKVNSFFSKIDLPIPKIVSN
ncbi:MAG: hypothetical protein V1824_00220 [archaeon]